MLYLKIWDGSRVVNVALSVVGTSDEIRRGVAACASEPARPQTTQSKISRFMSSHLMREDPLAQKIGGPGIKLSPNVLLGSAQPAMLQELGGNKTGAPAHAPHD